MNLDAAAQPVIHGSFTLKGGTRLQMNALAAALGQ